MNTLFLKNISKIYPINKSQDFYALKDINVSFPSTGLHAIIGKSGSGKSTLLNIIGGLDSPSTGEIYLNKKNYKSIKKKDKFYKNEVGIIFQQYCLLEDRSVIYNVALPLLIKGIRKKDAYKKAEEYLKFINLSKELFEQKCSLLSGGEKQRVAIARALIKEPKLILCDEPTGALDSANSLLVLGLLKKISKRSLVIVVTHNLQLINQYCDRILELSDGKIIKDEYINQCIALSKSETHKNKKLNSWTTQFALTNYKKRIKRNIFVCTALSIVILMANIVTGFICGKDQSVREACYRQLDFGSGQISKEEHIASSGTFSLVKMVRPELSELRNDAKINQIFEICPNFNAILPQNVDIFYDNQIIESLNYYNVYSFLTPYVDHSMIDIGTFPSEDDLSYVVINKSAYNLLLKKLNKNPIDEWLHFSHKIEITYITETGDSITDIFDYNVSSKVIGVVDELDYLSSPKIYYSYVALENYLQEYALINLSTYYDTKITWYDRVFNADKNSFITSYSYLLFLKDYRYRFYLFDSLIFTDLYSFNSSSLTISKSLFGFIDVAQYALLLFMGISLIGVILIISILAFTNYSEDRKSSAILSSLGAKDGEIRDIYLNESSFSALVSILISFVLSIPITKLINSIIERKLSVTNLINIPFLKLFNIPLLYPILFIVVSLLVVSTATFLPIYFSKKNSIKGELQSND